MRRILIGSLTAIFLLSAFADAHVEAKKGKPTSDQIKSILRRGNLRITGGMICKEGSAKGSFVVLNAQKRVQESDIQPAVDTIRRWVQVNIMVKSIEKVSIDNVLDQIHMAGGVLGVALTEDNKLSSLLTAPENGWSLINVASLAKDGADEKTLASRIRKEILRAFAFVSGGAYAALGDPVMRNVASVKDLDAITDESFGPILLNLFPNSAPHFGLVPWYQVSYKRACQEGWAPAPTNEFQKAIWDKVNATPKTPMKIEFDPKKGR